MPIRRAQSNGRGSSGYHVQLGRGQRRVESQQPPSQPLPELVQLLLFPEPCASRHLWSSLFVQIITLLQLVLHQLIQFLDILMRAIDDGLNILQSIADT